MPNWVKNIVHMKGISCAPFMFDEDGCVNFDFNKFIPMPDSERQMNNE